MIGATTSGMWQRVDRAERGLCLAVNRGCHRAALRRTFVIASQLGDGVAWYLLIAGIAVLDGEAGRSLALQMAVTGAVGVAVYRLLKHRLVRERPFVSHAGILCGTAPLDRYSFPSGHTLHAVCFTVLAVAHYPQSAILLVPFALLVAASRTVLGLHYPTDVAAGAVLGALIAAASLAYWPI